MWQPWEVLSEDMAGYQCIRTTLVENSGELGVLWDVSQTEEGNCRQKVGLHAA